MNNLWSIVMTTTYKYHPQENLFLSRRDYCFTSECEIKRKGGKAIKLAVCWKISKYVIREEFNHIYNVFPGVSFPAFGVDLYIYNILVSAAILNFSWMHEICLVFLFQYMAEYLSMCITSFRGYRLYLYVIIHVWYHVWRQMIGRWLIHYLFRYHSASIVVWAIVCDVISCFAIY